MSDATVSAALRSSARLVVIEAPAGCGKTWQGTQYAQEIAGTMGDGRVLILAHTHAATGVFASRTRGVGKRIEISTIDSLISQLASAYHRVLDLPPDIGAFARSKKDGYSQLAAKAANLLRASPMISQSIAQRYPIIICDEHQDASVDQHAIVIACQDAGASVRVFGDPIQRVYGSNKKVEIDADLRRWEELKLKAGAFAELDEPHRWLESSEPLGRWILAAREALRSGQRVDLRSSLPQGVKIIFAENQSPTQRAGYRLAPGEGKPIYEVVRTAKSLLVLSSYNATVDALHACFGRQLPIWEGHVRERLAILLDAVQRNTGNPSRLAQAVLVFLDGVATGFSRSSYGNILLEEVSGGCLARRSGKPAILQVLGRMILDQPDHKGVAKFLNRLNDLIKTNQAFKNVKIDCPREFWDAIHLGQFDDATKGMAAISQRRTYNRPSPPAKTISTIHKAKGLECDDVVIMPCDAKHFSDTPAARSPLYVAMSRARRSLTIVVSSSNPSPLVML